MTRPFNNPLDKHTRAARIAALHGTVVGDAEKFGALDREILGECL